MAKKEECNHPAYTLDQGALVCCACGAPTPSEKWEDNVFGKEYKATVEDKARRIWPSQSRRR